MRKILMLLLLTPLFATAQVKVKDLPTTTTGTIHDYLLKDDSAGVSGSTKKINILNFLNTYKSGMGFIPYSDTTMGKPATKYWTYTNYIPYSGAYQDADLGAYQFSASKLVSMSAISLGSPGAGHSYGEIDFHNHINYNFINLQSDSISSSFTLKMPLTLGTTGQVLGLTRAASGIGRLGWISVGTGSVTSVATGWGISGGTITTSGTISADTANVATRKYVQQYDTTYAAGYALKRTTSGDLVTLIVDTTQGNINGARIQTQYQSYTRTSLPSLATVGTITSGTIDLNGGAVLKPKGFHSLTVSSGLITWDVSLYPNAYVVLTGTDSLTITNSVDGGDYKLVVAQDGSGSRTLAVKQVTPSSYCVSGISPGSGFPLSTAASSLDILYVTREGVNNRFYWSIGTKYTH